MTRNVSKCLAGVLALLVGLAVAPGAPVQARPTDDYSGTHFGAGNLPRGCVRDTSPTNPANVCYHLKTGNNGLDSPQVDVLILVPVSPTAERDMRIIRQAVEMWEGGIDALADEMGLSWLAHGVDFHITVAIGDEFTTYPIVDPEIVVIASNPVGGAGIGEDPVKYGTSIGNIFVPMNENIVPCHGLKNPFDFEYWDALPGFDRHHDAREGTYTEDCGGSGGNTCFAVVSTTDVAPDATEPPPGMLNLFDTTAHEFGHCLALGHVGDGAEGKWGVVPVNDIMSYDHSPLGLFKCASTLDVEGIAIRMSNYLDVNGDGAVQSDDRLVTNDPVGVGDGHPMQVQHPRNHLYASATGSPFDCPQPDVGIVPGARTDWTPTPVDSTSEVLTVGSPADGSTVSAGSVSVNGTVEHERSYEPKATSASATDAAGDARSPMTDVLGLEVTATATGVDATVHVAQVPDTSAKVSPTSYSLGINQVKFDASYNTAAAVSPFASGSPLSVYPGGTTQWDATAKTVTFAIPRSLLVALHVEAPYHVFAQANFGSNGGTMVADDRLPNGGGTIGVAPPAATCGTSGCADGDGDGVPDGSDRCPGTAGNGADGCVIVATEHVRIYVDGVLAASQDVDTYFGLDSFSVPVTLSSGSRVLRVDWEDSSGVVATHSVTVDVI